LKTTAAWKFAKVESNNAKPCSGTISYPVIFDSPIKNDSLIMNNCACNDIVGLHNRYLKESENEYNVDKIVLDDILDQLAADLKPHFKGRMSLSKFMSNKKGKLLGRYDDACKRILKKGFNIWKDNDINAFIKNEIYDEDKPPRMIMGRNTKFNLLYGQFTTSLEEAMLHLPQISKGKNFIQRGQQFYERVLNKVMLECDFSKYESTQRIELLRDIELGIWKRLLSQKDYELIEIIFKSKMEKRGFTYNGVYFSFWGCRGSGDMDTGLFNTLLTYVACKYFIKINGVQGDFMCDGDDNGMGFNEDKEFVDTFKNFGFDAKIIKRYDYHDFDYCSGKFIQYQPGKFIYVQNLVKLMKNIGIFRKSKFNHCKGEYYYSLGYMYKQIYCGMPVFKEISEFLMNISKCKRRVKYEILEEINPMHANAFKNSGYNITFNPESIKIELAMCFLGSISKVEDCITYYSSNYVSLTAAEDKRFNSGGTTRIRLTTKDYENVNIMLECGTKYTMPQRFLGV
jgi:hypothetical protein